MIKGNHEREATLEVLEKENIDFERYPKLLCESEIFYSDYGNFFLFYHAPHLFSGLKLNTVGVKINCLSLFEYFNMNKKLFLFSFF